MVGSRIEQLIGKDLFAGRAPIAAPVKINPRIQQTIGRSDHIDRGSLADEQGAGEGDAVVVVDAREIVPIRIVAWLPVGLKVDSCAQVDTRDQLMASAV